MCYEMHILAGLLVNASPFSGYRYISASPLRQYKQLKQREIIPQLYEFSASLSTEQNVLYARAWKLQCAPVYSTLTIHTGTDLNRSHSWVNSELEMKGNTYLKAQEGPKLNPALSNAEQILHTQ